MEKRGSEPAWVLALRQHLASLPAGYDGTLAELKQTRTLFHRELASAFAPLLNAKAAAEPHVTHDDKRELAHWVNRDVRELGLSLRCPKTGSEATLVAAYRDDAAHTSRYRLQTRKATGHQRVTIFTQLPTFELIPDPPRREGMSETFEKGRGRG